MCIRDSCFSKMCIRVGNIKLTRRSLYSMDFMVSLALKIDSLTVTVTNMLRLLCAFLCHYSPDNVYLYIILEGIVDNRRIQMYFICSEHPSETK